MHPLEVLEFPRRVAKRAQYEAFEFTITADGVQVRNCSHADPDNHQYVVTVDDGLPVACDCPADHKYEGACKHRVAVAIRRPVLDAARQSRSRATVCDGGSATPKRPDPESREHTSDSGTCEDCLDDFPCWDCYRTGKRPLPE